MKHTKTVEECISREEVTECICDWCGKRIVAISDWSESLSDHHSWWVGDLCRPCLRKVGELLESSGVRVDWWDKPKQPERS